mmetsp:Transcript_22103/g.36571  ORF Transcript_22103/g.36571 Transcript_22103/m.36571 type:complete len:283 (+) Transcript_22103:428-1276(+)
MVPHGDMLNRSFVELRQELADSAVGDGVRTREVVGLVSVLLTVKEDNQGSRCHIVGGNVVYTHAVGSSNELMFLLQDITLVKQGSRHQMRCAKDSVGHARIKDNLLDDIITCSVKLDEWNVLTVWTGNITSLEEGDLHKVFNLLVFACAQETRKDIGPALHVRNGGKDSVDTIQGSGVRLVIAPVKGNDFSTLLLELLSNLFGKGLIVSDLTITVPYTNAHGLVPSFKERKSNTVSNETSSRGDENCSKGWIERDGVQAGDDIGQLLTSALDESHFINLFVW